MAQEVGSSARAACELSKIIKALQHSAALANGTANLAEISDIAFSLIVIFLHPSAADRCA
jgi:hypothetical protein